MRNSIAEEQCTFLTTVVGATSFIRAVGIPLTEALEAELPKLGIRHHRAKLDDIFTVDTGLKADVTGIVGIVGVLFFVGSWAATKLLDEILVRCAQNWRTFFATLTNSFQDHTPRERRSINSAPGTPPNASSS